MVEFPGIARAALEIALDNGGVNRSRPVKKQRRDFVLWLARQPQEILPPIDAWLSSLTDDQLFDLCCGGEGEPEREDLIAVAPPFTDQLLDSYFDEVC